MVAASIRVSTLLAVFAFASHAASIGVDGTSCGGDPLITSNVFTITTDGSGTFCDAFTNDLPGSNPLGGSPITKLQFTTDLSAGASIDDYNCFSNIFGSCNVSVNSDADLVTITFTVGSPRINGDFAPFPNQVPFGGTFLIGLTDFAANQTIEEFGQFPCRSRGALILPMIGGCLGLVFARRGARAR